MGSAIVGDEELQGASKEPDLSSATPRNDKGSAVMLDIAPFALVVQR